MKALKYFASALALVALFTACEEPNSYVPAELPGTQEAYFPATTMTVSMEELQAGFEVEIARVNYDEAATATLACQRPEGVNVPSSVSFNAGQEKTSFTVSVDQAAIGEGKTLKIVLNVDSESNSPYANQRCTVTLTTWSPTPPAQWVPIETEAVFVDNVISIMFNTGSPQYDVYVEKLEGKEIYRIANPFTTYTANGKTYTYPYYTPGDEAADAEEVVWWVIDCSGTLAAAEGLTVPAGSVWVPWQKLGIDWGYGHMVAGSIAGNLTVGGAPATPAQYPIGTYDAAIGKISLGMLGLSLPAHGIGVTPSTDPETWAVLYLDKNLMGTDFERDCAFSKLLDATYNSAILEDKWTVALYEGVPSDEEKAAEYAEKFGRVFAVPSAYVEGFNLYFCVNEEGKISVPEDYASQEMGLSIAGFDLYLNIKKGQYANNAYSLLCEMVGVDPTGVKADVTYGEYTEVINAEVIGAASSIDDFVGNYIMEGMTYEYDAEGNRTGNLAPFTLPVSMVKADAQTVNMVGLTAGMFGADYNDAVAWEYNGGYLQFTPQDLPNWTNAGGVEFDCIATLCGADGGLYNLGAAGLLFYNAGITNTGVIKFFNDPVNAQYDVEADGFGLFGIYNGSYYLMSDPYFNASMTAASANAARSEYVTKVRMTPVTGTVITELRRCNKADDKLYINGQEAQKKSKGNRTPVFRPAGNFVELR